MPKHTPTSSKDETNQPMTDRAFLLKHMTLNTPCSYDDRSRLANILEKLDALETNKICGKDALELIDISKRLTPLFQTLLTIAKATADAPTQTSNKSSTNKP
jgi:hypothetical protein